MCSPSTQASRAAAAILVGLLLAVGCSDGDVPSQPEEAVPGSDSTRPPPPAAATGPGSAAGSEASDVGGDPADEDAAPAASRDDPQWARLATLLEKQFPDATSDQIECMTDGVMGSVGYDGFVRLVGVGLAMRRPSPEEARDIERLDRIQADCGVSDS